MDSHESDIIILEELSNSKKSESRNHPRINGEQVKEEQADSNLSCNGEDDVRDFDEADLQVLDCWEDPDEDATEGCDSTTLEHENVIETPRSPVKDLNSSSERNPKTRDARAASIDSVKTIIFEDLTNLEEVKSAHNNELSEDKDVHINYSKTSAKSDSSEVERKKEHDKSSTKADSRKSDSMKTSSDCWRRSSDGEAHQQCKKSPDRSRDTSYKKPCKETSSRAQQGLNLPTDPTERKVDKFLKEMALQNSHIIGLQGVSEDANRLDPVSSESSTHSSHLPSPEIDLADLPPGVDLEQSTIDTSTSFLLAAASKVAESKSIGASIDANRQHKNMRGQFEDHSGGRAPKPYASGRYLASSKGLGEKDRKSRSPSSKHSYGYIDKSASSRSPPVYKNRKISPARSFTLSPSPSPKSRRLSPSPLPLPTHRIAQLIENFPSLKYVERSHYQSAIETSRYHRSPPSEESNLRALSRSLSRERNQSRSRSKSRGRSYRRHRSSSRTRNRFSSREERGRRYRRSSSRSRSPNRRVRSRTRSRSRSWSPHRYGRKRSSLSREDSRAKRARLSPSHSRSKSPWNIHVEVPLKEWPNKYEVNRNPSLNEDVQLEHDMARFIATNIAATGLRPPISDRGWFDAGLKARDTAPQSFPIEEPSAEAIRQGMGMPLPPPPPDISELMTAEEIKETDALRNMSPEVPAPSLSSLLESAVAESPSSIILERCQDAIMKLHDVSFKPGRFAVISSIKVPERKALSTFQLWQSVVNRSLPAKVHFNYCETTEPLILWESSKPKPKPKLVESRSTAAHSETVPSSSSLATFLPSTTADLDRAALLDKIFFLTRELQEVRDILDRKTVPKKHASVQTSPVNFCETCSTSQKSPVPNRNIPVTSSCNASLITNSTSRQRLSASTSSCRTQPISQPVFAAHQSTYPQPVPVPKPVPAPQHAPKPVPSPQTLPAPKPAPTPTFLSTPVSSSQSNTVPVPTPQPVPRPNQFNYSASGTAVNTASNSLSTSSTIYAGSTHKFNQSSNQLQSSLEETTKTSAKTNVPKQKGSHSIPPLIPGLVGAPTTNATIQASKPSPSALPKSIVPPSLSPMTSSDYDLRKYAVIGDEHGIDLRNYFLGIGIDIPMQLCSFGQTLDMALKNVISCKNLSKQVIVFMGLYNSSYNSKSLDKFKQLIGYLRKRCKHLMIIEPPPVPKFQSMRSAWQLYSQLIETFQPLKGDNVSHINCRQFLLSDNKTPNNSMFTSPERLSLDGLRLIYEEMMRTLEVKRNNCLWSCMNVR
ncbi:MAGE-like protein 2 [Frankliniella fusca]|uniref:MAGE-like protein 2 n=1 Tax=Frankliniella fusca TaxID=407009 RepID=A0AAE1GSW4_9NEOP|nr:MAGE-like protein 2 [Frankliniella fusca]